MRCSSCTRRIVPKVERPTHEAEKSHIHGICCDCEKVPKVRVSMRKTAGRTR